jgi:hypothetical protein
MLLIDHFNALTVQAQASTLKALRAAYLENRATAMNQKMDKLIEKRQAQAAKRELAIQKAQARLQKLLDKASAPVGAKAIKANRKPSKVTTYGAEDNAIASAIMARKATA